MGKVEKIVVLSVLFLAAIIIGIALTGDEPVDTAIAGWNGAGGESEEAFNGSGTLGAPERAAERDVLNVGQKWVAPEIESPPTGGSLPVSFDEGPPTLIQGPGHVLAPELSDRKDEPVIESHEDESSSTGLLNSEVQLKDNEAPTKPSLAPLPEDWDLLTRVALQETLSPDFKSYTCAADDTYESLAARFYGDASRADLLHRNNEGKRTLGAGTVLLIPVRDDHAVSGSTYEVRDNDSLWVIASRVYGKGWRWEEIYEANRDQLSKPEALRAEMVLRIP